MKYSINRKNATWRVLDGEAVIINNETSFYYSLNKTGTFIWNLLVENELSLEEIVRKVSANYGQGEREITADVEKILDDLDKEKFIKRR